MLTVRRNLITFCDRRLAPRSKPPDVGRLFFLSFWPYVWVPKNLLGRELPALRNRKHELFAQEIALGKPLLVAYVIAGYSEKKQSASRLAKNADICARVSEIQAKRADLMLTADTRAATRASNALKIDKQWVMKELLDIAESAKAAGDRGPALRAAELIGKELGMFVQRSENFNINVDFGALANRDDIMAAVAKEFGPDVAANLAALAARPVEADDSDAITLESSA